MRLEIGCGRKPNPGFKTVDIESYANPDFLGDFRTMTFSDVEEIYSAHLLEHFSRLEIEDVLKLWWKWLKLGGKLIIQTPDFEGICEEFVKRKSEKERYWLCRHAYGSQGSEWAFHRDGIYKSKLEYLLPHSGFIIDTIYKSVSRGYLPNITVIASKVHK